MNSKTTGPVLRGVQFSGPLPLGVGHLESSQRERCKLPPGVWGEAPADNDFLTHLERLFLALYFRGKLKTTLCVNQLVLATSYLRCALLNLEYTVRGTRLE